MDERPYKSIANVPKLFLQIAGKRGMTSVLFMEETNSGVKPRRNKSGGSKIVKDMLERPERNDRDRISDSILPASQDAYAGKSASLEVRMFHPSTISFAAPRC